MLRGEGQKWNPNKRSFSFELFGLDFVINGLLNLVLILILILIYK